MSTFMNMMSLSPNVRMPHAPIKHPSLLPQDKMCISWSPFMTSLVESDFFFGLRPGSSAMVGAREGMQSSFQVLMNLSRLKVAKTTKWSIDDHLSSSVFTHKLYYRRNDCVTLIECAILKLRSSLTQSRTSLTISTRHLWLACRFS